MGGLEGLVNGNPIGYLVGCGIGVGFFLGWMLAYLVYADWKRRHRTEEPQVPGVERLIEPGFKDLRGKEDQ